MSRVHWPMLACLLMLFVGRCALAAEPAPGRRYSGYDRGRHNPFSDSNVPTEVLRQQQRALDNDGRILPQYLKSQEELERTTGGVLRQDLRRRGERFSQEAEAAAAEEARVRAQLLRVLSRSGTTLHSEPDDRLGWLPGTRVAMYENEGSRWALVGRATIERTEARWTTARIDGHTVEVNPHRPGAATWYLGRIRLGPEVGGLTDRQFAELLEGRVWKGLRREAFLPMVGLPARKQHKAGSWGVEETFEYPMSDLVPLDPRDRGQRRPVLRTSARYVFRNGYLTYWVNEREEGK